MTSSCYLMIHISWWLHQTECSESEWRNISTIVQLNILHSNVTRGQTYSKQTMQECVIIIIMNVKLEIMVTVIWNTPERNRETGRGREGERQWTLFTLRSHIINRHYNTKPNQDKERERLTHYHINIDTDTYTSKQKTSLPTEATTSSHTLRPSLSHTLITLQ